MRETSLSVVIPVYNEAENIRPLVEQLAAALAGWAGPTEFLFVDDGSRDATVAELERAAEADGRVRVVRFKRNLGQTAALAAGFRFAKGDAIVTLDGDLQNDPADIPRLVGMLEQWDAVCGIRLRRQDGWWKRLSSRIANAFRNWVTRDDTVDTGCTLKAFRRECVADLELYQGMHRFLPTLIKMRGFRVTQVPVHHRPRVHGITKYGTWGRMVKGLADVYAVRWMKKNRIDFQPELIAPAEPRPLSQRSSSPAEKPALIEPLRH